jgi:hypothetical protein
MNRRAFLGASLGGAAAALLPALPMASEPEVYTLTVAEMPAHVHEIRADGCITAEQAKLLMWWVMHNGGPAIPPYLA